MATQGTNNNNPAVVRRVGSASNKNTISFEKVDQGQIEAPDASAAVTTKSNLSRLDTKLGGIRTSAVVGGKRDFTVIKTLKDYNTTGNGATKVYDLYGRVLVINGADIEVEKTASGQPKFEATSTTLSSDVSPGNRTYEQNQGLIYYTKMTASKLPITLEVGDALAS